MAVTTLEPEDYEFTPVTAEVEFPHGFVVTIRHIPEIEERTILAKNDDVEKRLEAIGAARIVSWRGLTPVAFVEVAPEMKVPAVGDSGEIEFNAVLKGKLYRYASGLTFRAPLLQAAEALRDEMVAKKKRLAMS